MKRPNMRNGNAKWVKKVHHQQTHTQIRRVKIKTYIYARTAHTHTHIVVNTNNLTKTNEK